MAVLRPASLALLLRRLDRERWREAKIFDLPEREFYRGDPALDTSVRFHGHTAATPAGPAAGPQDQLVQNILLSWLGGGRILELKTVQIMDTLAIPRPCIDATNVGYNVEWSQELTLEESLREYVAAAMALEIVRDADVLGGADGGGGAGSEAGAGAASAARKHATILDMSVGYDLEGIRSKRVRGWIESMMSARPLIDALRREIPDEFARYRDHPFETRLSDTITLSTFHGCPADEIERITEFLLREVGVHMTVKLNPTLLGKPAVDAILRDQLGYDDIEAPADAFDKDLQFDQCLEIVGRLDRTARSLGKRLAVKFSNTLVVRNHKSFFPSAEQTMYLSGQPLHVLTMNLVQKFRDAVGHAIPISFSAGIDQHNFADAVACGFTPVTVCTDLLRPGGYGRFHKYMENLEARMRQSGATNIGDFVLAAEGMRGEAARRAVAWAREAISPRLASDAPDAARAAAQLLDEIEREVAGDDARSEPARAREDHERERAARGSAARAGARAPSAALAGVAERLRERLGRAASHADAAALLARAGSLYDEMVAIAGVLNTAPIVERVNADPRYAAARNRGTPRKVGSHLVLYDCVSCNKCVPVCPNDANFRYDVEPVEAEYSEIVVTTRGAAVIPRGLFRVERASQWATYADFCNECGNCDVFCPEEGGPYLEKARFFASEETYGAVAPQSGFLITRGDAADTIRGRVGSREYTLRIDHVDHATTADESKETALPRANGHSAHLSDEWIDAEIDVATGAVRVASVRANAPIGHSLTLDVFFILRTLMQGALDARRANYLNA